MDNKKAPSPFAVLWGWASGEHGGYYASVALAVLGVACGMVPYFCVAAMIGLLLEGGGLAECLPWCGLALAGYAGKALFSTWSTSLSHTATYHTLRRVRQNLLSKLSRVPMGTILDTPSGQYKTTIVDRVEGMEPTLAHLLPEMTSNLLVPVSIAVYIFVLDWRMGLASLVTTGIGFTVASQSGKTYADRWQGAVEVGRCMANAIVEYVGGIQVVKAFSQSAGSYKRYSDAVTENAQYYVDWMADNQKYMAIMQAVIPSVLLPVLPVGLLLWGDGSLSTAVFLTIVVLSLGLTGPLVSAMTFVDELAVVGTNVGEISAILDAPELKRPTAETKLNGLGIRMDHVSFAYRQEDGEVLHDVNLDIRPGTVTALVGPSGSGKSTFTNRIKKRFGDDVVVLYHDNYYRRQDGIPFEQRVTVNYDHPDSLETELLVEHLKLLRQGKAIDCPVYDYSQHNRSDKILHITPSPVILVEGILLLADPRVRELLDIKVYVEADADERILRRISRDVEERGRDLNGIIKQYLNTVKPMHYLYVEPTRSKADIVINSGKNDVAFDLFVSKISMELEKRKQG